jgi:hypothetical protein
MAMIRPKSQKFKIGHDGILSIGNFILMIKNHRIWDRFIQNRQTTGKRSQWILIHDVLQRLLLGTTVTIWNVCMGMTHSCRRSYHVELVAVRSQICTEH